MQTGVLSFWAIETSIRYGVHAALACLATPSSQQLAPPDIDSRHRQYCYQNTPPRSSLARWANDPPSTAVRTTVSKHCYSGALTRRSAGIWLKYPAFRTNS